MQPRFLPFLLLVGLAAIGGFEVFSADLPFRHHFIHRELPVAERSVGDYGLTALVDLEGDRDLDFVLGGRASKPSQLHWFEFVPPDRWIQHAVGTNDLSDVVIADADITDSKVAVLKNADGTGGRWEKLLMPQSLTCGSLHSLAVADLNGDGRPDIFSNEQEELLPGGRENPRWIAWENLGGLTFREHVLLDARLGGHELRVGDVDRDGDMDICSKAWGPRPWNGNAGRMHVDSLENLRR